MFGKEIKGLKNLAMSSRIAITAFLLLMGLAYIFGFLNIYFAYSPVDQKAGLSMQDIRLSFYGSRKTTVLEKAVDGSMKEHFASDKDYNTVKDWIAGGAKEKDFKPVKKIFDEACLMCHSKDAQAGGVVLVTYSDSKSYMKQDTGKSISRLISLSHAHLFGIGSTVFLLVFIFSFTLYSEKLKIIIYSLSFFAIAADIGSWWLAKLSGSLSFLVIMAGSLVALAFALLTLLPLYDMWIGKKQNN